MIERKFIKENLKEFRIQEYVSSQFQNIGHSYTKLQKTPLGEKIIICSTRPGMIVGKSGSNITRLTKELKEKFELENPQIELVDVENIHLDANVVAQHIASSLERFGSARFKGIGHKTMSDVMNAGAFGVEILISGKIPGSRSKSWRFYQGYLKKCGDMALTNVRTAQAIAKLKTGVIGIKVSILPPHIKIPDHIEFTEEKQEIIEETDPDKEKPEEKPNEKKKQAKTKK